MATDDGEPLYAAVYRAMSEGVVVHDGSGRILSANPSAQRILGLTFDQMTGRTAVDPRWRLITEDGSPLPQEAIPSEITQRTGEPCRDVLLGVDRGGERAWLTVSTEPVLDAGGRMRGVVATFIDVTAAHLARKALEVSRAQFQRVTDAAPCVLFQYLVTHQEEHRLVFLSAAAEAILGVKVPDALARLDVLFARSHPDDLPRLARSIAAATTEGTAWHYQGRVLPLEGGVRAIRGWSVPEEMPEGRVWNGVIVDVTEEVRLQDGLRRAQRMEAMGDLAAGVAHNFNNMLAVVLPNLEEAGRLGSEEVQSMLADARQATLSAADLVSQLLLVARRDRETAHEVVDLVGVVDDVVRMCRRTFDKTITIEWTSTVARATCLGSPSQLQQVLLNLCQNARDALLGRPTPRIQITLHVERTAGSAGRGADRACLEVRDNGAGMSEETRHRVGEPFFTTKAPGAGTGLGIATAIGVIRDAGGELTFDSIPGEGTTFHVVVPTCDPAGHASAPPASSSRALAGARILIVDDEPLVRRAVTRTLRGAGATGVPAQNGMEGLRVLEQEGGAITAVILDLLMPELPGLEVLRRIREKHPRLPVVVFSGDIPDDPSLSLATRVLRKPAEGAELLSALTSALTPGAGHLPFSDQ